MISQFWSQLLQKKREVYSPGSGGLWIRAQALEGGERYEFHLQADLKTRACLQIEQPFCKPFPAFQHQLQGCLLEWRHAEIRSQHIGSAEEAVLHALRLALEKAGVRLSPLPCWDHQKMRSYYQPLGPLMDTIRFFLNPEGYCTFLCPSSVEKKHLRLV